MTICDGALLHRRKPNRVEWGVSIAFGKRVKNRRGHDHNDSNSMIISVAAPCGLIKSIGFFKNKIPLLIIARRADIVLAFERIPTATLGTTSVLR